MIDNAIRGAIYGMLLSIPLWGVIGGVAWLLTR
jgi:hypothetical protein